MSYLKNCATTSVLVSIAVFAKLQLSNKMMYFCLYSGKCKKLRDWPANHKKIVIGKISYLHWHSPVLIWVCDIAVIISLKTPKLGDIKLFLKVHSSGEKSQTFFKPWKVFYSSWPPGASTKLPQLKKQEWALLEIGTLYRAFWDLMLVFGSSLPQFKPFDCCFAQSIRILLLHEE